jgi:hypothetical protein
MGGHGKTEFRVLRDRCDYNSFLPGSFTLLLVSAGSKHALALEPHLFALLGRTGWKVVGRGWWRKQWRLPLVLGR